MRPISWPALQEVGFFTSSYIRCERRFWLAVEGRNIELKGVGFFVSSYIVA